MGTLSTQVEQHKSKRKDVSPKGTMSHEEFDNFFDRYRVLIILSVVVGLIGIIAAGLVIHFSNQATEKNLNSLHSFESGIFNDWKEGKLQQTKEEADIAGSENEQASADSTKEVGLEELVTQWNNLEEGVRTMPSAYPVLLEMSNAFKKEQGPQKAYEFLAPYQENLSVRDEGYAFLSWPLAVYADEAGKREEAFELYRRLSESTSMPQRPLALLQLARLSKRDGKNAEALAYFQQVMNEYSDSEEAKTARALSQKIIDSMGNAPTDPAEPLEAPTP